MSNKIYYMIKSEDLASIQKQFIKELVALDALVDLDRNLFDDRIYLELKADSAEDAILSAKSQITKQIKTQHLRSDKSNWLESIADECAKLHLLLTPSPNAAQTHTCDYRFQSRLGEFSPIRFNYNALPVEPDFEAICKVISTCDCIPFMWQEDHERALSEGKGFYDEFQTKHLETLGGQVWSGAGNLFDSNCVDLLTIVDAIESRANALLVKESPENKKPDVFETIFFVLAQAKEKLEQCKDFSFMDEIDHINLAIENYDEGLVKHTPYSTMFNNEIGFDYEERNGILALIDARPIFDGERLAPFDIDTWYKTIIQRTLVEHNWRLDEYWEDMTQVPAGSEVGYMLADYLVSLLTLHNAKHIVGALRGLAQSLTNDILASPDTQNEALKFSNRISSIIDRISIKEWDDGH